MAQRRSRPIRRFLVLALVVAGLIAAGCGTSGDDKADSGSDTTAKQTGSGEGKGTFEAISGVPGVSDDAIAFAGLGTAPATDPLGGCNYECYIAGVKAYFAFRNSEGGVNGRKLEVGEVVDDQLGNNQVKSLELIQGGKAFGVFEYPTIASGFADLAKAGVPLYTVVQFAPESANQESTFVPTGAGCLSCTSPFYGYAAQLVGAKKVASLGYGVSPASKQCVKAQNDSIEKYSSDDGVTVAYSNDDLQFGLPNGIAPEVTKMKQQGVQLIMTCLDQRAVSTIEQELQRQGSDAKVLMPRAVGDPTLLQGSSADLFEGDVSFVLNRPYEDDGPGTAMPDFLKWIAKGDIKGSDLNLDTAIQGWISADMAYQGILAAGPKFDRAKVIAATNGIEDYTADGLLSPLDFGRQHIPPTEADPATHGPDPACMIFAQVKDGKWTILGDQAKPWSCWSSTKADQDPTSMDFR
jgi:ABC-type branched-subunit amino acid transport system substrate-binding protein